MTATPQAVAAAEWRLCEQLIGVDNAQSVVVRASDLRLVLEDNTRLNRLRNDLARFVSEHASELTGKPEPSERGSGL